MGCGFLLEFIINFLSNTYVGQPTLHTRKIDQNIARLQHYDWFHAIYHHDQYRNLFLRIAMSENTFKVMLGSSE